MGIVHISAEGMEGRRRRARHPMFGGYEALGGCVGCCIISSV